MAQPLRSRGRDPHGLRVADGDGQADALTAPRSACGAARRRFGPHPAIPAVMSKAVKIGGSVLFLVLAACGWFYWRYQKMAATIDAQHARIAEVELATVGDGVYTGHCGDFLVAVDVELTVRDHRIEAVRITDQRAGQGHEAREVTGRIVAAQTPKVDAVSGATGSSYCIMVAADRALQGGK
jgi:uncharacterized protein with FMN-binding domain